MIKNISVVTILSNTYDAPIQYIGQEGCLLEILNFSGDTCVNVLFDDDEYFMFALSDIQIDVISN